MKINLITNNDGPRLISTNWYDLHAGDEKTAFSFNARCLRVLLARTLTRDAPELARARIAVLSIGKPAPGHEAEMAMLLGRVDMPAAHIMFDDDSDSPYCLFSSLNAFDVLPRPEDDGRTDLTCAVYVAAPDLTPSLVGALPLRIRHTPIPNFDPAQ